MRKFYLHKQICSLLLLIVFTPSYGQTDGNMFHKAIQDKAGNLWFATTGAGVYRYEASLHDSSERYNDGQVETGKFTNFTERDGLCDNNVSSILEDKAENLWFSTEDGVCRYDPSTALMKSFIDITLKEGLCKFYVNCIVEDRNGNFWFGTNGYGVCRYNPISGEVFNFTKEHGLGSNAVQCILEDKVGNLWFGERAGGVSRYDTATGRFTKVNGGCLSSQITGIIQDKTGNIWFANLYNGVCRYDPTSGEFTHFTKENGLCSDTITCIYEDKKGNIWFGTDAVEWRGGQGGVSRYDPSTALRTGSKSLPVRQAGLPTGQEGIINFSIKDGLGNVGVWTIIEDNNGTIWAGTRRGLFRFHSPSGRFINYTYKMNR